MKGVSLLSSRSEERGRGLCAAGPKRRPGIRWVPAWACAAALAFATLLPAADFWETKTFTEWSAEEATRILTDSPWARTVERLVESMAERAGVHRHSQEYRQFSGDATRASGGSVPSPRNIGADSLKPTGSVKVLLRWVSALPVRQAVAVRQYGAEAANSPEAVRMMMTKGDHYVLGVTGLRKGDLPAEKPEERITLKVRGRPPLHAAHLQAAEGPDGPELYVFFPKAKSGGYDITVDDKSCEVELKFAGLTLRRSFKLEDMVYYGKLQM